jgi:hypothetical protein
VFTTGDVAEGWLLVVDGRFDEEVGMRLIARGAGRLAHERCARPLGCRGTSRV